MLIGLRVAFLCYPAVLAGADPHDLSVIVVGLYTPGIIGYYGVPDTDNPAPAVVGNPCIAFDIFTGAAAQGK